MAQKSKYKPHNPEKYAGDPTKIIARSNLERKVMRFLDSHSDVISWSSEEVVVPYLCLTDNKWHRYFVDFFVKMKRADGKIDELLIEVKPSSQTKPPKKQTRKTRRYVSEVLAWGKNSSKWAAAEKYCKDRGWKFKILTEREIGQ